MIIAYADGASSGNPGLGGWAIQLHHPDGLIEEFGGTVPQATNNYMELLAVCRAMEHIRLALGEPEVLRASSPRIYTDSSYVVQGVTAWLPRWRENGWRTGAGTPVAHGELWRRLQALEPQWFQFHWVRGHSGHEHQERVDQLAAALAQGKAVQFFTGYVDHIPRHTYPIYLALVDGRLQRFPDWRSCRRAVDGRSQALYRKVTSSYQELEVLRAWGCL